MAKQVKNKWVGARVDDEMSQRVVEYTEHAKIDMADLVRDAVEEYMRAHPVTKQEANVA